MYKKRSKATLNQMLPYMKTNSPGIGQVYSIINFVNPLPVT